MRAHAHSCFLSVGNYLVPTGTGIITVINELHFLCQWHQFPIVAQSITCRVQLDGIIRAFQEMVSFKFALLAVVTVLLCGSTSISAIG